MRLLGTTQIRFPDTRKKQYQSSYDSILFYTKSESEDYPFYHQEEKREKPIKVFENEEG